MGKNTQYSDLINEITEKVKANGSSSHSTTDLNQMAYAMINSPGHAVQVNVGREAPEFVEATPVKRYRDALKPVLKQFGIDREEANRIDDLPFTKEHGAAIANLSVNLVKDYIGTGRKLTFPITTPNESRMSISQTEVDTKVTEPRRITKDPVTGEYSAVPTGKKVTTKKHQAIKSSNKVPVWLKDIK